MTFDAQRAKRWLPGVATAFFGVALHRLVAPHLAVEPRALVSAAGQLIALGGLFLLGAAIRRGARDAAPTPPA